MDSGLASSFNESDTSSKLKADDAEVDEDDEDDDKDGDNSDASSIIIGRVELRLLERRGATVAVDAEGA